LSGAFLFVKDKFIGASWIPKVSPCGAIFNIVLAVNIAYYGQLPKTLNLTPPELMNNPG